ncbi:MAG: WbqC family protein [Saprospiraceae bacterium]|nr:WbqC family protein [Saprospiraceae bacterium]
MQQTYIFELQFFPSIYFFCLLAKNQVVIEKHENYQKRSFRNKCIIANATGHQTLTVPLKKGKHERQPITEVQLAYDEPWQENHLAAIRTAYSSAPYFEYYYPHIEHIYHSAEELLFDFNWSILHYFTKILQLQGPAASETYSKTPTEIDYRGKLNPKTYHEIALPKYNQVFEDRHGYLSNLSILDLIFCKGPEAAGYLTGWEREVK